MAALEKLALRGIRSFSPDDEQTIEFYSPLTMIVGQNGSGKTTIIECLKYACTGKLPPGGASTAGQSWVHDPKLTDETEVKASVKLRFRARDQKRLVVVRSLQLQYKGKAKNATFKQLEGVIKFVNPVTKKSESLGHKCQDLNAFIPQSTGISAAILDSVVFCHQEESSWPLQDGATLKKKFDDIFESTRYTKALEAIEKVRKVRNEEHKNLRLDLASLTENRETATDIRRELEAKTAEIQDIQAKQQQVENKMNSYSERIKESSEALTALKELAQAIESKTMLLEDRARHLAEKKKSLGASEMKESTEALQERLTSFAKDQEEAEREVNRLRQKEGTTKKSIENNQREMQRVTGQQGEMKAKLGQLKQLVEDLNKEIAALCDKYALPVPSTLSGVLSQQASATATAGDTASLFAVEVPGQEMKRFRNAYHAKKEELSTSLQTFRSKSAKIQSDMRGEMTALEAKLLSNESTKKARQVELKEMEQRVMAITNELHGQVAVPATIVESLRQEVTRAKTEYEQLAQAQKTKNLDAEISKLRQEVKQLGVTLDAEQEVWESMKVNSKERTEYDMAQGDYVIKSDELKVKVQEFNRNMYRPHLQEDLAPELESIQQALTYINTTLEGQHHAAKNAQAEELKNARKELTALATNQARDREEAEGYRAKVAEIEARSRMEEARGILRQLEQEFAARKEEKPAEFPWNFDEADMATALQDVHAVVEYDLQQQGSYTGLNNWISRFLRRLDRGDECPCCKSALNDDGKETARENLTGLFEESAQKQGSWAENLARHRGYLTTLQACAKDFDEVGPVREKLATLETRIGEAEQRAAALNARVQALEQGLKDKEEQGKRLVELKNIVLGFSAACGDLHKRKEELEMKKRRLQSYAVDGQERTQEEVEESLKRMRTDQKEKNEALQRLQVEQSQATKLLLNKGDLVRSAEASLEAKLKTMQRSQELEKEKETLKVRQKEVAAEVQRATEEEIPLRQEHKNMQANFDNMKARDDKEDRELQRQRIECTQRWQGFETLQNKLEEAKKEGVAAELETLEKTKERLEADLRDCQAQLESLAPKIHAAAKALEDKDQIRRQINDNLDYRRMVEEQSRQEEELAALGHRLDDMDDKRELEKALKSAQDKFQEARDLTVGYAAKVNTLSVLQGEQQAKLSSEKFRHIEKRYRETKIKCDTTHMAVEDLQKYHKALDRALMQYHKMKIEEINKIIRELWTRTYQGNDIEEIAIVSGEDGGGRATRSYNYRVVMKKGQTLLDMRGRCSAGQRVLASIVIRLALAETFCINCGVMTLDEPTTNLDHDNKGGLARAIARLIAERSRQQNFQLIVITHDEDFVDMVKQELSTQTGFSMPEYYWRVSREAQPGGRAYSTIQQVEWGTI